MRVFPISFSFSLGLLLLGGCASVSVQPLDSPPQSKAGAKPQKLLVEKFRFPSDDRVRVDRTGAELDLLKKVLQANMQKELINELRPLGIEVEAGSEVSSPAGSSRKAGRSQPAWLINGEFTRINQGSRALRIGIGLGAGGTKMETLVKVVELSKTASNQPELAFQTTGGSNAEPGLIASVGTGPVDIAVSAALTIVGSGVHGVTEDTRRTARMIAAYISEDLARRGFISPDKVRKAKRLGPKDSG